MKSETGDHSLRLSLRVLPQVDTAKLAPYFENMPLDPYVPGGFRHHRLSCLEWDGEKLLVRPERRIFQSAYINPIAGNIVREYPPVQRTLLKEPSFLELVKIFHHFSGLPVKTIFDVHMLRTQVVKDNIAEAAPEGVHRDDVDFLGIFCVNRHNLKGGTTFIYQNKEDETPMLCKTLRPGELLLVNDNHVYHYSNKVYAAGPGPAYRDVLILTTPTLMQ